MDRIVKGPVAKGEVARRAALVADASTAAVVDGVNVDFQHAELPPGEWAARPFWYVWGYPPTNAGVIFPSEAKFGLDELRRSKGMDNEDGILKAILVNEGDGLSVERVECESEDRRFDHPHDIERRLAYLQITRADGVVEKLDKPLAFFGVSEIRNGALRQSFDNIAARAEYILGRDISNEWATGTVRFWDQPFDQAASQLLSKARCEYADLAAVLDDISSAKLLSIINAAALGGFLLAKHELREAERIADGTRTGLDRSHAARRDGEVLETARAIWKKNRSWTANRVARDLLKIRPEREQTSLARSIMHLAPITSPSHPDHPKSRRKKRAS